MFDPQSPRIFAEPIGVDFSQGLYDGLRARLSGHPPEAMARVTLLVSTRRMARRLQGLFRADGAAFLPRLMVVSDPAALVPTADLPQAVSPLRLQLELAELVAKLLDAMPGLAPRSAAFDLAKSLRDILAEMQEEEIPTSALEAIRTDNLSNHWERSLQFLRIVSDYLALDAHHPRLITPEARQAAAITALMAQWATTPPQDPVIVAGSTGSRGPTLRLMQAVLHLPQGALILPGFDTETPDAIWTTLANGDGTGEDHPQFRYHALCAAMGAAPQQVVQWSARAPACRARNALVSLALRPAPVTDQWRTEGPDLPDLAAATQGLTLVEARSSREEALTIALRLRAAVEEGKRVALISPDRILTRQVTATLDRWGIEPDDSAGLPLGLSAPGRVLRSVANLRGRQLSGEDLLAVLKHPLVARGGDMRGDHLRHTRDLELEALRGSMPFPDGPAITAWAKTREAKRADRGNDPDPTIMAWVAWLGPLVDDLQRDHGMAPLGTHFTHHITLTEALVAGPGSTDASPLWSGKDGEAAREAITGLQAEIEAGADMLASDYGVLVSDVLTGEVRDPVRPHPDVMIWGAMEARIQTTDLMILAGLNDGTWPGLPNPDPWMNRRMRADAGLRSPDRRIGLSAHDWQQAISGPEVWLTRSTRDAETETIPSRWLNRLTNLLGGLGSEAAAHLKAMRARGDQWRDQAMLLDVPDRSVAPEPRPAPAPPVAARPRHLSVTEIQKLIRDPYAIYARHVLGLRPLDPLRQTADARLRGSVLHDVLEAFVKATPDDMPADPQGLLETVIDEVLTEHCPWPANRRLWRARLLRAAPWFLATEGARRAMGRPALIEEKGGMTLPLPGGPFRLSGKADRIDENDQGDVAIYDYKTGAAPTDEVQKHFDKQLPLEALIVEDGGFKSLGARTVAGLSYLSLSGTGSETVVELTPDLLPTMRAEFIKLLSSYDTADKGYTARRAMQKMTHSYDFDHLARMGEWDETADATTLKVGQ